MVLLATGNDDGGKRATLAFTAATCAAAMDKRTIVFMVGDGAHWAYEGRALGVQQKGFPPLEELDFSTWVGRGVSLRNLVTSAPRHKSKRHSEIHPHVGCSSKLWT